LSIVERTVGFHVSNILKKLEVTSRVEAAMWAQEQGIVS
jgi:DNA-binding NarL/FixJ family response regulator